jgi:hypothetical protein
MTAGQIAAPLGRREARAPAQTPRSSPIATGWGHAVALARPDFRVDLARRLACPDAVDQLGGRRAGRQTGDAEAGARLLLRHYRPLGSAVSR